MESVPPVESRSRANGRWILGRYVQLVALLQVVVYATAGLAHDPNPALASLDPRFLIYFAIAAMTPGQQPFPSWASGLSALGMLCLGQAVVQSRSGLAVYTAVEGVYAGLFLAFSILVVAANLSSSHGISPPELIIPFAVFTAASAVPLMAALPLWRAPDYGD